MVQMLLELEGYTVATAANGAAGLAYLQHTTTLPDLILLDLWMPEMDGWAFCRAQQAEPPWSAIPVILMTAIHGIDAQAQALGIVVTLRKPSEPNQLLDLITRFCCSNICIT